MGAVEMYDDNRYFTVTGNHLPDTPEAVRAREELRAARVVPHAKWILLAENRPMQGWPKMKQRALSN